MSFESWVESQIRRGQERGEFDELPGAGKPLRDLDRERTSYDWALAWARRENADVLGMLPPGLALRKEREGLPGVVARLPSEEAVRALVEDFNARVRLFWRRPSEGPAVVVGLADVEELVAGWRRARPAPEPHRSPADAPAPHRRTRWFRRKRPG
jgi:hypothetical protein